MVLYTCRIKCRVKDGTILPNYQTEGSSGADVCACLDAPVIIPPGGYGRLPTGLFLEIPPGYEVQVRPRSGLAAKFGVTVLNSPGTIDNDYRGEVQVILVNHGAKDFTVRHGDRIAQLVAAPVVRADFSDVEELSDTKRGEGGFGSTGI
ncbi:MAG: dUTP diphosphatase [Spirochaetaceae bacterium]|jgi:dUTP pyrophosphatase|nr:dUTP diphosphatase [Spirochaetaceae bacterium]